LATSSLAAGAAERGTIHAAIHLPRERRLTLVALTSLVFFHDVRRRIRCRTTHQRRRTRLGRLIHRDHAICLEPADVAHGGGACHADARRRRLLHLGPRGARAILGCAGRVLDHELLRGFAGHVSRALCQLFDVFLSRACSVRDCRASIYGRTSSLVHRVSCNRGRDDRKLARSREVGSSAKISATFVLGTFTLLVAAWLLWGPAPGTAFALIRQDLASHRQGALLLDCLM